MGVNFFFYYLLKINYHFDNNTELHQSSVDFDQKNTRFLMDQNSVIDELDLPAMYPEIDLMYVVVFRILSHLPKNEENTTKNELM